MPAITDLVCDFTALAAPGVRALSPYQPGKPESELRRELGINDIVKLASNENPLGPSPLALTAIQACIHDLARYPDGAGFELKSALAATLGVARECITLGNGSNDVLELAARAFLTPAHEAVFSEHAFIVYPLVTQALDARARIAKAYPADHPMAYGHDLDAFRPLINAATRLVFIANPNNPTGTWIDAAALEAFLADLPAHVITVVDEAYVEYVEAPEFATALPWIERFPNLIVTRTFSKAYGLAGLRVGYAVSHPQVADLLNRVRQPFNVNTLALEGARAALADHVHLERSRAVNRAGLAQLRAAFAGLGLRTLPSVGNFLCVDMGRPAQAVFQALLHLGVIVRPVAGYGLPHHLRITVGSERENRRLIDALNSVLRG